MLVMIDKKSIIYQMISNIFRMSTGDTETNLAWKSKRLSDKTINPPCTPSDILAPGLK